MLNTGLVRVRFVLPEKNKDRLAKIDWLGVGRRMKIDVEENRFQKFHRHFIHFVKDKGSIITATGRSFNVMCYPILDEYPPNFIYRR